MKNATLTRRDPLARLALWFYVTKGVLVTVAVMGAILLAVFLVFLAFARQWLVRLAA